MNFSIEKIETSKTYPLRKQILRNGIELPFKFERDQDQTTFHLGAFFEQELVGIASFMKSNNIFFSSAQYQLRGMATSEVVRGKGAGKALLGEAVNLLRRKEIKTIWCNARIEAITFYKKVGFKVRGELFVIEKVGPHFTMFLDL